MKHLAPAFGFLLAACAAPERVEIDTPQGPVVGQLSEAGNADFRGLPFAQPPVGEMRFRAPGPAPRWDAPREALDFSPMCMQSLQTGGDLLERIVDGHGLGRVKSFLIKQIGSRMGTNAMSEDCLYLNVKTPDTGGAAPVMVWIHGGGHQFGSGDFAIYQGEALPDKGAVVVTPNYRLNLFGYLAHPLLSADDPNGVSGNYGLRDQIAALQWVRDNIAAYGGDPDNVTLFGESAGASSIAALMASPAADGLFDRAILQSGESTRSLTKLRDDPRGESAEAVGERLVAGLAEVPDSADALRQVPADALVGLGGFLDGSGVLRPIADGLLLPGSEAERLYAGEFRPVPVMVGYNADEAFIFYDGPGGAAFHAELTGDDADQLRELQSGYGTQEGRALFELYGFDDDDRTDASAMGLMGDEYFGVSARFVLEAAEAAGAPAWAYAWTRVPPSERQTIGAYHSAEMPFVFGTQEPILGVSEEDRTLEALMQDYWVSFAQDGDPNGPGLPEWPRYEDVNWMEFTANTGRASGVVRDWREDKLDALWSGLDPALRRRAVEPAAP